jgi:vaccinia related kinase
MPPYIASGTHDYRSQKYRFLIIPRYGQDLHKVIQNKPGKRLGIRTVLAVALQVVRFFYHIPELNRTKEMV